MKDNRRNNKEIFQHPRERQTFLALVKEYGNFADALTLMNIRRASFESYCRKNPEFDAACDAAREEFKVNAEVGTRTKLKTAAMRLLEERVRDKTISDPALMKILGM